MPVIVNIAEKDKPFMGYILENGKKPGPQCVFG
jgi:hypothetical protein